MITGSPLPPTEEQHYINTEGWARDCIRCIKHPCRETEVLAPTAPHCRLYPSGQCWPKGNAFPRKVCIRKMGPGKA